MIETTAKFFTEGGTFMWVILAVGAVSMAVIAERLLFFYTTCRVNPRLLVSQMATALSKGDIKGAIGLASKGRSPIHKLLKVAAERYDKGLSYAEIEQGVEESAIKEIPRFSNRLSNLGMFANIATLTGLLGTIFGLQLSFNSLQLAEGADKATALANGIAQAMNTTAMGLLVAIPCMIAFTQLSNIQAALTEDADEATVKMLNFLEKRLS